MKTMVTVDT